MKSKFNKNWIFIAVFIIANILVFRFFSHRLEKLVTVYTIDAQTNNGM